MSQGIIKKKQFVFKHEIIEKCAFTYIYNKIIKIISFIKIRLKGLMQVLHFKKGSGN